MLTMDPTVICLRLDAENASKQKAKEIAKEGQEKDRSE